MYRRLEISEFRGIRHAVLDNLGEINILVGRNDMGKSSCLDAAYLLATGRSEFRDAIGEDVLKRTTLGTAHSGTGWDYLIRTGSAKATVTGRYDTGGGDGSSSGTPPDSLVIAKTHEGLDGYSPELLGRVWFTITRRLKKMPAERRLLFHLLRDGAEVFGELYAGGGGGSGTAVDSVVGKTPRRDTGHTPPKALFVRGTEPTDKKMYDWLVKTGTAGDFITQIKEVIPDVTGIRIMGDALYLCTKNGENLPVETAGDGIRTAVLAAMASCVAGGGTVMIDDLGGHMHSGLMFRVIDTMVSACKGGTQFIISTHSYEILDYILEAAPPDLRVSVFRISKTDKNTVIEDFDRAAASECLNKLGVDLRGL